MNQINRMPALAAEEWSDQQRILAEEIINGPRGALLAPFEPLLRSPELMAHVQHLGEYLRYRSAIGHRLTELAILITARHWSQIVEWAIHAPIAEKEGIHHLDILAINKNELPKNLKDDEIVIYNFCVELLQNKKVSDFTWNNAIEKFGEKGVMDLIGINGYYSLLSMVMNSAQTPAPNNSHAKLIF